MKKIFKNFKIQYFIGNLSFGLSYPIVKTALSENKALVFSDSCFIMCLMFLFFAIINAMVLSGDFDIVGFTAKRRFPQYKELSFISYKEEMKTKRKDSFNYPFVVSICLLIISWLVGTAV